MAERVLDWRKRGRWLRAIPNYATQVLTIDVRRRVEIARPKCWSDDLAWLPHYEELVPEFCEKLWGYYTHAKAFHGCRPDSVASYFEYGLQGQSLDRILQKFREIFADVPTELLDRAVEVMHSRRADERGCIWFSGDDEKMIRDHGHYIINGSEYLLALAAHIDNVDRWGEDYRLRLRTVGIPTILEVDIPVDLIPENQKLEVARMILSEWGQLRARKPLGRSSSPCYVVRCDIPASCIKAHYHPTCIPDFHTNDGPYQNRQVTCELCL